MLLVRTSCDVTSTPGAKPPGARLGRRIAITLVVSGAVGNLYDRLRWSDGVVDFIGPIDLGFWLFPIFNVADMAITCGAVLLAISFWFEEQAERKLEAAAAPVSPTTPEEATS